MRMTGPVGMYDLDMNDAGSVPRGSGGKKNSGSSSGAGSGTKGGSASSSGTASTGASAAGGSSPAPEIDLIPNDAEEPAGEASDSGGESEAEKAERERKEAEQRAADQAAAYGAAQNAMGAAAMEKEKQAKEAKRIEQQHKERAEGYKDSAAERDSGGENSRVTDFKEGLNDWNYYGTSTSADSVPVEGALSTVSTEHVDENGKHDLWLEFCDIFYGSIKEGAGFGVEVDLWIASLSLEYVFMDRRGGFEDCETFDNYYTGATIGGSILGFGGTVEICRTIPTENNDIWSVFDAPVTANPDAVFGGVSSSEPTLGLSAYAGFGFEIGIQLLEVVDFVCEVFVAVGAIEDKK
jgi:hypothetical protein